MRLTLAIFLVFLLICEEVVANDRFMVRKGGHLERMHKRTLSEWKRAHHRQRRHRHKRRRHERDGGSLKIEHILAQMDSYVRPRFGRSAGFREELER